MPEVSICIPTFNGARHLRDCLDSAITQSFENVEIVVVDDASTDDTVAIVKEYAAFDSRVTLFSNEERLGLVGNWNRAIALASAPWIKLLFQDDMLTGECVNELYGYAKRTSAPFVACFRHFLFEEGLSDRVQGWYTAHQQFVAIAFESPIINAQGIAGLCLDYFAQNFVGEPTVTLIRRDMFEHFGVFDRALAHRCDAEFWYRVGTNVGIAMLPQYLSLFRVHRGSASNDNLSNRRYANEVLDPLIILHLFVNDDRYSRLRSVAKNRGVLDRMTQNLRDLASAARRDAIESETSKSSAIMDEWRRVTSLYPALIM